MKKLLLSLLLSIISSQSFSAISDVYSCEWVSSTFSGSDGEEAYWNSPKEFLKKTFVFKREENNIAFEKDFLSSNTDLQISLNSNEVIVASSVKLLNEHLHYVSVVYKDGNFTITSHQYWLNGDVVVNTDIAKCYIPELD
ncbi:hypothetical protein [Candidatus Pseudothioglobus sp. Uisw_050_01]|uniref:hypothetical protein n=1 Tax=Candidatus Pseudothioglobus sp. Uisw_050_01 TaxID=3230997 RepID=UPI003A87FF34